MSVKKWIQTALLTTFSCMAIAAPQPEDDLETLPPATPNPNVTPDSVSIDVGFPGGGSALGTSSMGARLFLSSTAALALGLQYSLDAEQDFSAYGATLRGQWILATKGRSMFYTFAQLSGGATKNNATSNSATTALVETSAAQTGGATGAGIEIFLLPELSASAEVGLSAVFSPSNRTKLSTATSQIAVHFFFPQ